MPKSPSLGWPLSNHNQGYIMYWQLVTIQRLPEEKHPTFSQTSQHKHWPFQVANFHSLWNSLLPPPFGDWGWGFIITLIIPIFLGFSFPLGFRFGSPGRLSPWLLRFLRLLLRLWQQWSGRHGRWGVGNQLDRKDCMLVHRGNSKCPASAALRGWWLQPP